MKFNCLIEVDIRVKALGDDGTEDKTLADGCMEFVEGRVCYERFSRCSILWLLIILFFGRVLRQP